MFTSGTEITTAVTDLINALVALMPTIWLLRQKPLTKRNKLWATAFAMFVGVSVAGFLMHGIVMSKSTFNILWCGLYLFLTFMICSYVIAVKHDLDPEKDQTRSARTSLIVAAVIAVLLSIVGFTIGNVSFVLFSIYAMSNLVYCIVILSKAVHERPAFKWYIAAIIVLIIGSVLQSIKTIRFTIIWPFNYNAVYHWVTLLFVLIQFKGIRLVGKIERKTSERNV